MVGEEGGKGGETSGPCYAHRDTLRLLPLHERLFAIVRSRGWSWCIIQFKISITSTKSSIHTGFSLTTKCNILTMDS